MAHPIVLAMTGASGAAYAVRLLQQLLIAHCPVHLVLSPSARTVIHQELGIQLPSASHVDDLLEYRWPKLESRWGVVPISKQSGIPGTGRPSIPRLHDAHRQRIFSNPRDDNMPLLGSDDVWRRLCSG